MNDHDAHQAQHEAALAQRIELANGQTLSARSRVFRDETAEVRPKQGSGIALGAYLGICILASVGWISLLVRCAL